MTMQRLGRAAAWGTALTMAAATSLLVLIGVLWAQQQGVIGGFTHSLWHAAAMFALMLAPWGTMITALMIRERTGQRC